MSDQPDFQDIVSAAKRLEGHAVKTPVLTNDSINQLIGSKVYFKCENLQRIGAFKFRGAYNAISRLSSAQKNKGVIAFSSGNHAQAVARVSQLLGISATIIMPNNAPKIKCKNTESFGATVIEYDPFTENREDIASEINKNGDLKLIPPFNHKDIIAGQGTAAFELHNAVNNIELILTPCGGGGLLSGTALITKHLNQLCKVAGVEPETADDATRSMREGKIVTIDYPKTIADGTQTLSIGNITFSVMQQYVDEMITVSEETIKQAVKVLFSELKQVVEPSGALGLAALMTMQSQGKILPKTIGVIISGGNIDAKTMRMILKS